jgi:GDP-L-fucose synthase
MKKRKVLITGATGFIGRNLIEKLAERNDLELYGTYFRTVPKGSIADPTKVRLAQVDLTDKAQVEKVVKGMDIVIQAAAVTTGAKDTVTRPYIHVTDNAVMNALLYRACFEYKVGHVFFFSCTTMYASQDTPVREEDFNHQIADKYFGVGWTKVYNEKMCEFYSRIGSAKYTVMRHSNIYGPWDKYDLDRSHVFGATVTKVMTAKDGKITVWGDGSETRDVLYISDLVDFVELAIDKQTGKFELVNLGCGGAIPIRELVERIIAVSGRKIRIDYDVSKPTIKFNLALNIEKARERFGWEPKVSLEEGICKTLAWYMANYQESCCDEKVLEQKAG